MKRIPLSQGKFALVDDEDFETVGQMRWYTMRIHNVWYAASSQAVEGTRVYLHRFLMDPPSDMEVDHINGDGLDNRRENLRVCLHRDNLRNVRRTVTSRSGFRGVLKTRSGRWEARTKRLGRIIHIGTFDTPEEAARARDRKIIELHGEFAVLNFPREDYEAENAS